MLTTARIVSLSDGRITIEPSDELIEEIRRKSIRSVELRVDDGRRISNDQRKKIFALIRDIADWSGDEPEYIRQYMTWDFCRRSGNDWFSLSDVDMTTATQYISYLIEFCFTFSVPTRDSLLDRTDDISKYLYLCLAHRKCAVCNKYAEVHHVDRIGMGRNREKIFHEGLLAVALCREHHIECHADEKGFFARYFIYGIELDRYLCERLKLKRKKEGAKK